MALSSMVLMPDTRGQAARRRREALGVARERLAAEAEVSVKTIKSYEDDVRENMPSAARIEDALDRLEARRTGGTQSRRASDNPKRRALEAMIETQEGERVTAYLLGDGTRAIFVVPPGGRVPPPDEIERAIREARDDEN